MFFYLALVLLAPLFPFMYLHVTPHQAQALMLLPLVVLLCFGCWWTSLFYGTWWVLALFAGQMLRGVGDAMRSAG